MEPCSFLKGKVSAKLESRNPLASGASMHTLGQAVTLHRLGMCKEQSIIGLMC